MPDLWLATCKGVGAFHDEAALPAALAERGVEAAFSAWQDIRPDGTPIVVRTTWDYTEHRDDFAGWLDAIEDTGTPCWNSPARMQWNMDKRYLLELEARGHTIIPTLVLDRYSENHARAAGRRRGWPAVVAKPIVGAGAEGLVILDGDQPARGFDPAGLTWMRQAPAAPTGACLVQPLLDMTPGEWSLFYFAGRFSHAILKTPKAGDVRVQEEHGGRTVGADPPTSVRHAADAVAAEIPDALYARVDGVVLDGRFAVMELELIEPELYFRYAPGALERFADVVAAAVGAVA